MLSDAVIARQAKPQKIVEIAKKLGFTADQIENFGHYKAKITPELTANRGKMVLVTAMSPTPLGEGKTTMSIGLADALTSLGKNACLALREPSLGPVFGIKGGACGGGYAQVVPMEDINLHFTGDFHALTSANNLLSALIDNHIYQGNELGIKEVIWSRCLDLNDRALRSINVGVGGGVNGVPRSDGFVITAASEMMAILCLSTSLVDLKRRIGNIVIAYGEGNKPIFVKDLGGADSLVALLKGAIMPNLVQTLEGTPAIVHGGPFANIAHGCNTIVATKTALSRSDYVITEAGFGAELGAEKFLDIKCRVAGIAPSCTVLVVTARSIKYNGGVPQAECASENLEAIKVGFSNVKKHIRNLHKFNQKVVVAINRFYADTDKEIALINELCVECGSKAIEVTSFAEGGKGAVALAEAVIDICNKPTEPINFTYPLTASIKDKISAIACNIYGAREVVYSPKAEEQIAILSANKAFSEYPVCIAKTQYSFSTDAKALGSADGFVFEIQDVKPRGGAEFLVVTSGKMLLMPGLPKSPNTDRITIDDNGIVDNLM